MIFYMPFLFVFIWFWPLIVLWIISLIYGFKKLPKGNQRPLHFIIFTLIGSIITTFILFAYFAILSSLEEKIDIIKSVSIYTTDLQPYFFWLFISASTSFLLLYLGVFIKYLSRKIRQNQ